MQETITLTNLEVFAYHGVFEAEKELGQPFYLTIKAELDTPFANLKDNLKNTVSYAEIANTATHYFKSNRFDLIEDSAYFLAKHLLIKFSSLKEVELTVSKPHAPIPLPFENVSVSINLKWTRVYLSVGSNMGDSKKLIQDAYRTLQNDELIKNPKLSSLRETKPWGKTDQPNFINAAIELDTLYSPEALLQLLNTIEAKNGRVRHEQWGERTLDLDIIYFGDKIIYQEALIIPHLHHKERAFVLEPLVELNPYIKDPLSQKTVSELLEILKRSESLESNH